MRRVRRTARILTRLFKRKRFNQDLDEELRSYLGMMTDSNIRKGMPPVEAARQARIDFGGMTQVKERVQDVRSEWLLDSVVQDVRFGMRLLARNAGFAIVAVLTVAIGIASATTIFKLADAMLFQAPAGVIEPERVVSLWLDSEQSPGQIQRQFSYPEAQALREVQDVFQEISWHRRLTGILLLGDHAESVNIEIVEGNHFSMLGVTPAIGRVIQPADDRADAAPVAFISYGLWQRIFGQDPAAIGRVIHVNQSPFTVVGVAAPLYGGVHLDWYEFPQVWLPLHSPISSPATLTGQVYMPLLGRLRDGVTLQAAERRLNERARLLESPTIDASQSILMVPLHEARITPGPRRESVSGLLATLMGVSLLILLTACFNVGSFLIGQAADRRHEMAVRLALGGSRRRILQQLITESALLAGLAGAVALILTVVLSRVILQAPRIFTSIALDTGSTIDFRGLGFAMGLTLASMLLFGLLPAAVAARRTLWKAMKADSPACIRSSFHRSPRQALLLLQVAVATVLVVTGALYTRSLYNVARIEPGFSTSGIVLASVDVRQIPSDQRRRFEHDLHSRVANVPAVVSAGISARPPSSAVAQGYYLRVPRLGPELLGLGEARQDGYVRVPGEAATSGYFRTLGSRVISGRIFTEDPEDVAGAVMVNDILAARLGGLESALGRPVEVFVSSNSPVSLRQVVGVVAQDNCWDHLREPQPCVYLPLHALNPPAYAPYLLVRVSSDASLADHLRTAARESHPNALVYEVSPMGQYMGRRIAGQTLAAAVTSVMAAIGILLSVIGCYAVLSSTVKQSGRELALRMALGATASRLIAQTVLKAILVCGLGVALGLGLSTLIAPRFQDQLFEVQSTDAEVMAATAVVLVVILLAASLVPSRSIARTDPSGALKVI